MLSDLNLIAERGDITCLLGASGCGKTTLLRLAAGVLNVQHGEIRLDGELLADAHRSPPPEKRPIGLVFQEGALFPHLTIYENISFGIEKQPECTAIVNDLLDKMDLSGFAKRFPHTLSGGQQQRVALARALAPSPRVLLLDEPFANVDIVLRRKLREETRQVLKDQNASAVLVTHDPEEAMQVADRIAVMDGGEITQFGSPSEIYDNPASERIGALFGDGQILTGIQRPDGIETAFGIWQKDAFVADLPESQTVKILVRPHALTFDDQLANATIEDTRIMGNDLRIQISASTGARVWIRVDRDQQFDARRHDQTGNVGLKIGIVPKCRTLFAFAA